MCRRTPEGVLAALGLVLSDRIPNQTEQHRGGEGNRPDWNTCPVPSNKDAWNLGRCADAGTDAVGNAGGAATVGCNGLTRNEQDADRDGSEGVFYG